MLSIFANTLSSPVAKHIGLSATRRLTLSWLALLIIQHGTIGLWRLTQRVRQTQHVTYFPHRHSLRRHRSPPGCQGDRLADSTVDGRALYAAITCCPQSPDCCPPCAGNGVRVAPDSP